MATQTVTVAKSESCVAIITYDDLALTASSCTLANISGNKIVTFWITVAGVTQFKTVPAGASGVLVFITPFPVILIGGGIQITSLDNFGIGVGVDTSVF